MSGLILKLNGVGEVLKKLSKENIEAKVNEELSRFGNAVRTDAIRLAPVNEGRLRSAIFYQVGNLQVTIGCNVDYAAYVEFGTRKFAAAYVASLPGDWQTFAAKFRGSGGGTFEQFVMAIFEWVRKKGLRSTPKQGVQEDDYNFGKLRKPRKVKKKNKENDQRSLAYAIALKILREGIKPQPFLFPAFEKNRASLNKRLGL